MILDPKDYMGFVAMSVQLQETNPDNIFVFNAFPDVDDIISKEPDVFLTLKSQVETKLLKTRDGIDFIDDNDYISLRNVIDNKFSKNAEPMFEALYLTMIIGHRIDFGNVSKKAAIELCKFAAFWTTKRRNAHQINNNKNKDFLTSMNVLKESFFKRSYKEFYILNKWLLDWAKYLLKEQTFDPTRLPHYKQGDIIRVDFGWRVGNELGGIHYAIVIEKNNNPKNHMIFLVPISSYKVGRKINPNDVDLGKCIGDKHSYAVLNQMGSYSKMRILEEKVYKKLPSDQLSQIVTKLSYRIGSI